MLKRKVYSIRKTGSLSNLELKEEILPDPQEEEVCIQIKAIGLNFADLFAIFGLYSATPKGEFTPGLEYSGVVIKIGEKVTNFKIGDRVMGVTRFGAYTNYINANYKYIYKIPSGWSDLEGASFIVQGLTAYYALKELGNIKPNSTILIHSAAGGVGILANRIAKRYNCFTIGTIGNESKLQVLKEENYDAAIVRTKNFYNDLKSTLGDRELNLVLDCIGGKIFQTSYDLLSRGGRIIIYGAATFTPKTQKLNYFEMALPYLFRPKIDPLKMISENKSVLGFNLIWMYDKLEFLKDLFKELLALSLPPQRIGKVFAFLDARQALEYFQKGTTVGKILLEVKE